MVFARPKCIQRTTANNVKACISDPADPLGVDRLVDEWAAYLSALLLFFVMDSALSNDRIEREFLSQTEPAPQVYCNFFYCVGHMLGLGTKEAMIHCDMLDVLHQFAGLMKHHDYREKWLAAFTEVLPRRLTIEIISCEAAAQSRASSAEFYCRVGKWTVLRTLSVASRRHILSGDDDAIDIELEQARQLLKQIERNLTIVPSKGFSKGYHFHAPGSLCDCPAEDVAELSEDPLPGHGGEALAADRLEEERKRRSHIYATVLCAVMRVVRSMCPTNEVSGNRWESQAPSLAMWAFLVFLCGIGPVAWQVAFPKDAVDFLDSSDHGEQSWEVENSKRLSAQTRFWKNEAHWPMVTMLNLVLIPADKLLRFISKVDMKCYRDSGETPNLYYLLCQHKNPIIEAFREYSEMLFAWWRHGVLGRPVDVRSGAWLR